MSEESFQHRADDGQAMRRPIAFDFGVPTLEFPPRLVDGEGRRIRPGSSVKLLDGRHGEVTTWRGGDLVEVIVDADDELDVKVVQASDLVADFASARDPVTIGMHVRSSEDPQKVTLIQPIGGRDLVSAVGIVDRRLPLDSSFPVSRGAQSQVDARQFGEACLEALKEIPLDDRPSVVARELDAPILRRAVEETVLPRFLHRLVLVATDQVGSPHSSDSAPFAKLLELWVKGTAGVRKREVGEIEILTLRQLPHRVDFVIEQVTEPIRRFARDSDELVIVQAGGTPAMSFGVLAVAMGGLGIGVRHVQIPERQAVVELDFPLTVRRTQVGLVITELVRGGKVDAAIEVAESFGFTSTADTLRAGGDSSEWTATLESPS